MKHNYLTSYIKVMVLKCIAPDSLKYVSSSFIRKSSIDGTFLGKDILRVAQPFIGIVSVPLSMPPVMVSHFGDSTLKPQITNLSDVVLWTSKTIVCWLKLNSPLCSLKTNGLFLNLVNKNVRSEPASIASSGYIKEFINDSIVISESPPFIMQVVQAALCRVVTARSRLQKSLGLIFSPREHVGGIAA